MIKALIFDIDGTLIDHETGEIPSEVKDAFYILKEKGIKLFINSGRHISELEGTDILFLPFDGYSLSNGQICYDKDLNIFHTTFFSEHDSDKLIELYNKKEFPVQLFNEFYGYANMESELVKSSLGRLHLPIPKVQEYKGDPIYFANIFAPEEKMNEIIRQLEDTCATQWSDHCYDINPKNADKSVGSDRICEHYHIREDEYIAFGDGYNDLNMLKKAYIGVAMGNAKPEVKEAADFVTTDVGNHGIIHALKYYKLLD